MSWDSYVAMITNVFDAEAGAYTVTGVGQHGGIFGFDGTKWGTTEGFDLTAYDYDIVLDDDGNTQKVAVDEPGIFKDLLNGNDKGGDAGVRLGNEKYMVVRRDGKFINLSKKAGGAVIGKAKTCAVIGVWTSASVDSTGKNQNPGDLHKRVEALVEYLEGQGY